MDGGSPASRKQLGHSGTGLDRPIKATMPSVGQVSTTLGSTNEKRPRNLRRAASCLAAIWGSYAAITFIERRRRMAVPARPKPVIIIAQVAGSGTAEMVMLSR